MRAAMRGELFFLFLLQEYRFQCLYTIREQAILHAADRPVPAHKNKVFFYAAKKVLKSYRFNFRQNKSLIFQKIKFHKKCTITALKFTSVKNDLR
jgi:hypothetical protein